MPRVTARDSEKSGDADLRGIGEPRSRPSSDRDPAADIGVTGGAVFKREEFAQIAIGVSDAEEAVLGSAFVGTRVLGSDQRERNG